MQVQAAGSEITPRASVRKTSPGILAAVGKVPTASAAVFSSFPRPASLLGEEGSCVQNNFLTDVSNATLEKAEAAITEDVVLARVV